MQRDVTRKRRVRDVGRQNGNARIDGEFVETVRHEFRTRLTSIAGSLGLLIGGAAGPLPPSAMRFLQIAHDNSRRLVQLIDAPLDTRESESGRVAAKAAGKLVAVRAVAGHRPRVLHVDDDRDVLHVVAEALRGDADIVSTCSISEARRALADGGVDLAILDRTLADGDGLDLLAELRNSDGKNIPAIVFSGHDATPDIAARVGGVFTKSGSSLEQLRGIVRQLAARRGAPRQAVAGRPTFAGATSREVA